LDEEDSEFKEEDEEQQIGDDEEAEDEVEGWDDDENVVVRRSRPNINEEDAEAGEDEDIADEEESRDKVPSSLKPSSQASADSISRPKPRKQRIDSANSSQLSKKEQAALAKL
jgi:hypothetical protein